MNPQQDPSQPDRNARLEELVSQVFDASVPVVTTVLAQLMQLSERDFGRDVRRQLSGVVGHAAQRVLDLVQR